MIGSIDRVAPDANASGLSVPGTGNLPDRFVGQGTGAGYNPHLTGLVNIAGHNSNLALVGGDDSRTIGSDQTGTGCGQPCLDLGHIADRNALGDGNDQWNFRINCFENRIGGKGRRYINRSHIGPFPVHCFLNGVENWNRILKFLPPLSRSNASDHIGAVFHALCGVKTASTSGDSLNHESGVFIY